jgi:hypothetical protein
MTKGYDIAALCPQLLPQFANSKWGQRAEPKVVKSTDSRVMVYRDYNCPVTATRRDVDY